MPTVPIAREVTGHELAAALAEHLGPKYHVQVAKRVHWGFGRPEDSDSDDVAVSVGTGRFSRTQVSVERDGTGHSTVRIEPPGPIQLRMINRIGVSKKVHQAILEWARES